MLYHLIFKKVKIFDISKIAWMRKAIFAKVRLVRSDCIVFSTIKSSEVKIELIFPKRSYTDHIISSDIPKDIRKKLIQSGVKLLKAGDGKVWARTKSCSACNYLSNTDAIVLGAYAIGTNEIVYSLMIPSREYFRNMLRILNDLNLKPIVQSVYDMEKKLKSNKQSLSPRQLQALLLAYHKGYFDVDRKTSLIDIAKMLGIAPSSAQELLRRALRKVVEGYIRNLA
jgi:Predicted DNA binding protein